MNKVFLAVLASFAFFGLTGCDKFNNSPEQKAFHQFLEHCKAEPAAADCQAYNEKMKG